MLTNSHKEAGVAYLFALPALILLSMFILFPALYTFVVSMHEWNLLSGKTFVGLDNYKALLNDTMFWNSLKRSIFYASIVVPLVFCMSLMLALLVRNMGRGSRFFRTVFFFPTVLSIVVSVLIWKFILTSSSSGLGNVVASWFGFDPIAWLGSTGGAWFGITNVFFWTSIGFYMLIMLSGLLEIPVDLYEAAKIDGASPWMSFWKVTVPQLKNTMVFVLIVNVINAFQYFDIFLLMTKGGPARGTEVTVLYIYNLAFNELRMGYASAISFVLFILIFLLTLLQNKLFRITNTSDD